VSLAGDRAVRVHRVFCVVDCGLVVNPNLVRQQIEGSIVFGLSAALRNEVTIVAGRVQQRNFNDGLALRMHECPAIDIDIVKSGEPPAGVGECGVPPVAPAVANALFALTGERFRRLPLRPA
jgi:isoquinoline 1-oxidoreductase beta subunit